MAEGTKGLDIPSCSYLTGEGWSTYKKHANITKPHTLVHKEEKAPTVTEDGTKEYWQCSVCDTMFSDDSGAADKIIDAPETIPAVETVTITVNLYLNGNPWGGQNVTLKIRDGDHYPASEIETGVYQGIVAKGGDYFPCLGGESIGQNYWTSDNGSYTFTFRYVTVTYEKDSATGTVPEEENYYCGSGKYVKDYTVKETLPLTKSGYVQTGWSETSGGSGKVVQKISVNEGTGVDGIRETPIVLYPVFRCNAALYGRQKPHFIFDTIDTLTALSFRWLHTAVNETAQSNKNLSA